MNSARIAEAPLPGASPPPDEHAEQRDGFSLREFTHHQAFGGILLLICAVIALIWANSPWKESYSDLWHTSLTLGTVHFSITEDLQHWVNDGLMAIFFFVVGLEIKREVLVGQLASPRRAALPGIAALGGVLVPAAIYVIVNWGGEGSEGWGIPMATDIAFALGVLALLGDRVPVALKVFLTALAIVDDIMAVLVIAFFYTSQVHWQELGIAGLFLIALVVANRLNIRFPLVYALLGIGMWAAVLESGVHATVAGVLLAFVIPASTRIDPDAFVQRGHALLDEFAAAGEHGPSILTNGHRQETLAELENVVEGAGAPLQRLEHTLHPWVAYFIVPVFALANAGVDLSGGLGDALGDQVTLGVIMGLVLGKQIGVTLAAWIAVRSGLSDLPELVTWRQIYGAGCLAGIGFTMSLFVSELAFAGPEEGDLLNSAKVGILMASLIAGVLGWIVLGRGHAEAPPSAPDEMVTPVAEIP